MRLITVAGLLVFSAGSSLAAYVVDLDAGDRMTVDSYWEDGDRMHLIRGGVDLSVPRSRVREMHEVSGPAESGVKRTPAAPVPTAAPTGPGADRSRKELEGQRVRIERHLVRAHMEISEAQARGDQRAARRLEKEITRTQRRRDDVKRALDAP